MFALFLLWQATKSSARTILSSFVDLQDPQASPPSAAHQQLWIFAAFGDAFLRK